MKPPNMVDRSVIRVRLARVARSIRAVMRCLGGNRESQEGAQRAMLIMCELLDLLCRLQDQLNWAEDKWVVDPSRLRNLDEVARYFESTIVSIEIYFQPGGISARSLRKRLLENTFIPRLEHFKVMMILSMQPESRYVLPIGINDSYTVLDCRPRLNSILLHREKSRVETKLRVILRQFYEMDSGQLKQVLYVPYIGSLAEPRVFRFNKSQHTKGRGLSQHHKSYDHQKLHEAGRPLQ